MIQENKYALEYMSRHISKALDGSGWYWRLNVTEGTPHGDMFSGFIHMNMRLVVFELKEDVKLGFVSSPLRESNSLWFTADPLAASKRDTGRMLASGERKLGRALWCED